MVFLSSEKKLGRKATGERMREHPAALTTELQMPVGTWQDSNLQPADYESK